MAKKKKGKKKKKKAVDPNDKLVKDTGDGQITINLDEDEDHEIGESSMFAKLDSQDEGAEDEEKDENDEEGKPGDEEGEEAEESGLRTVK